MKRKGKLYHIEDDTKLLHLLSESGEEGEENDWLFIVITDIVSKLTPLVNHAYNCFNNYSLIADHTPQQLPGASV